MQYFQSPPAVHLGRLPMTEVEFWLKVSVQIFPRPLAASQEAWEATEKSLHRRSEPVAPTREALKPNVPKRPIPW